MNDNTFVESFSFQLELLKNFAFHGLERRSGGRPKRRKWRRMNSWSRKGIWQVFLQISFTKFDVNMLYSRYCFFIADCLKMRAVAASILGADSCAAKEGVCGRKEHAVDRVQTPEVKSAWGTRKRRGPFTSKGRNYLIIEERVMLLLQQVLVVRSRVVSLRTGAATSKLDGRRRMKEHSSWCAKCAVNRDSKGRAFLDSARRQTD